MGKDIIIELEKEIEERKENFNKEIKKVRKNILSIFNHKKEVDDRVENIFIQINTKKYNL